MVILRHQTVTARKPHPCFGCCAEISPRQLAEYNAGVYDGSFFAYYLCLECAWFVRMHGEHFEDGIREGDVKIAREEEVRHDNKGAGSCHSGV